MWFSQEQRAPFVRREPVDDSPLRQQILAIVRAQPGIPIGELMGRLGIGWGTVYHHIAKLTRQGLIRTHASGRRRLIFPAPYAIEPQEAPGFAIVRGATAQRIARSILAKPGQSVGEICQDVAESPRVVYYHVKRLLEAGLVESSSRTRHHDLRPSVRLGELLAHIEKGEQPVAAPAPQPKPLHYRL